MAFETLTPLISYPADGVTTTFAIPDKFYDASDVKLFFVDATGVEGQYNFGADYSVVITATDPTPPARKSGNVVLVTPPAIGISVVVFIWPDSDQDQPFEGQPVTPRQNERVHDRHAMRDASLRELLFRGFRAPLNAAPALRYIEVGAAGRVPVYAPDGSGSLVEGPTVGEVALVSGIVDEIIAVAAISASVVTVAANNARVTIVADNIANVNAVGNNIASVVTVAGSIASVNTVAANIVAVNNVHMNMASVVDAVNQATAAAASALLASRFATYPEDTDIPGQGGLRSALHWAAKAAASAATAAANIVGAILGYATKATPAAGDLFGFVQASDSTGRKLSFSQLITALAGAAFVRYDAAQGTAITQAQRGQFAANAGFGWEQIGSEINFSTATPEVIWQNLSAYRYLFLKGTTRNGGTSGTYIFCSYSTDNGATWSGAGTATIRAIAADGGGLSQQGAAFDGIYPSVYALGATTLIAFNLELENFNKATQGSMRADAQHDSTTGSILFTVSRGTVNGSVARNALRLKLGIGSMPEGTFTLWGKRG